MKKKILFILNPASGNGGHAKAEKHIIEHLDAQQFDLDIRKTHHPKHATGIVKENLDNYDIFAAIGGDGTVNEVARPLINTDKRLAILPMGSGNGLARHLGIPMTLKRAVQLINKDRYRSIDVVSINRQFFFNMAGVGFDAHISHLFGNQPKRGFGTYFRLTASSFFRYRGKSYSLCLDGKRYEKLAFLVSFANSKQFGNNAYIAPQADIDDGQIDVCVLRPFPIYAAPGLAFRLFNKTIEKSKYYVSYRAKSAELTYDKALKAHLDGDPHVFSNQIIMRVLPRALRVLTR